jgi:hypothetical protein
MKEPTQEAVTAWMKGMGFAWDKFYWVLDNPVLAISPEEATFFYQTQMEAVGKVSRFNWICQKDVCGNYNPYDCHRCRVCGKERPTIYLQPEVDAITAEARREALDMFEHRIDCCTLISELEGWKGCVEQAKYETENQLGLVPTNQKGTK